MELIAAAEAIEEGRRRKAVTQLLFRDPGDKSFAEQTLRKIRRFTLCLEQISQERIVRGLNWEKFLANLGAFRFRP